MIESESDGVNVIGNIDLSFSGFYFSDAIIK